MRALFAGRQPVVEPSSQEARARRRAMDEGHQFDEPGRPRFGGQEALSTARSSRKEVELTRKSVLPGFILFIAAISLAACAGSEGPRQPRTASLPDAYGIYALTDDRQLVRLDGNREWEMSTWNRRSDFGPDLEFVIFDRSLGRSAKPLPELVTFYRVPVVRNEVSADGTIAPATENTWIDIEREEFRVPVDFSPYLGRTDAVVVKPRGRLESGLYAIRLVDADYRRTARAGVRWPSVDKAFYAQSWCVDRVRADSTQYRLCSEEPPGAGLRIALDPPRRESSMVGEVLAVEGSIENRSAQARTVPPLVGTLLDARGTPIRHWNFDSRLGTLAPGQSLTFRELVGDPPPEASRVRLTFTETNAAAR